MAAPTEAEVQAQLKAAVHILEEYREFGEVDATNALGLFDTAEQALEGDFNAEITAAIASIRTAHAGIVSQGTAEKLLAPIIRQYGRIIAAPESDVRGIFKRLKKHFDDNSYTVNSRAFSFGSPSAGGGNTGDGEIHRVTVDADGYDIESQTAEAKTARIVRDMWSGASQHEEEFEFFGEDAPRDALETGGSGLTARIRAMSARESRNYIRNPSFEEFTSAGSSAPYTPTGVNGWTINGALSNFQVVESDYYRDYRGILTPRCLRFTTNDYFYQDLTQLLPRFDPETPYYLQIAYKRENSCDGTFKFYFGGLSAVSVTLSTAGTGWKIAKIPLGTSNWFKNFVTSDMQVKVELTGRTTGELLVDDIIFAPMRKFANGWYAPVGGTTRWLRDDEFTWTDSISTDAVLNKWFARALGDYLPSDNTGSETLTDP